MRLIASAATRVCMCCEQPPPLTTGCVIGPSSPPHGVPPARADTVRGFAFAPLRGTCMWDRTTGYSGEIGQGGDDPRGRAAPTLLPVHGTARLVVTKSDLSPVACSWLFCAQEILICTRRTLRRTQHFLRMRLTGMLKIPPYANYMKDIVTNKRKIPEAENFHHAC